MSDLSQFDDLISQWSFLSIPLAVFIASILGSTHCVSMCGPIVITVNNSNSYVYLYHIGRLISYLILGALAGLTGETFLSNNFPIVSTISVVLISIFFIYSGFKLVMGKPLEFLPVKTAAHVLTKSAKWSMTQSRPVKSLTIGIINGFLPCGWLYIFVIAAVATKSPLYSTGLLFVFWLGTVPALSLIPYIYKKALKKASKNMAMVAGIILIVIGIINISAHILPGASHHDHNQIHETEN